MTRSITPAELRLRAQHRLAITVPDPNTHKYPEKEDCPNTYWIVFVDADFDLPQGNQTPTIRHRQLLTKPRTLAYNLIEGQEGYVPQSTLIEVSWHNRQWWFQYIETTPCSSSSSSSFSDSSSKSSGSASASSSGGSEGPPSGSQSSGGSGSGPSGSGGSPSGSGSGGWPHGSESSGSDKSTAIVPARWSPTGYTALFIAECPEVRFDDVMTVMVSQKDTCVRIDPKFLEVCEPGSVQVCGCVPDLPVLVGAVTEAGRVRLRFAEEKPGQDVRLTIRLTGIRKGFKGQRFPDRTREQFEANERFLSMAKPK